MTRKDYILLARQLRLASPKYPYDHTQRRYGFDDAVEAVCHALAEDNPRFDRERFKAAVDGRE